MKEIVALCHSCHNFIHSGRLLAVYQKREIRPWAARHILEKGLSIVYENGLEPFYMARVAYLVIVEGLDESEALDIVGAPEQEMAKWEDWRLVMDDVEYKPLYKDIEEWAEAYGVELDNES